jgi:hypothetical protein
MNDVLCYISTYLNIYDVFMLHCTSKWIFKLKLNSKTFYQPNINIIVNEQCYFLLKYYKTPLSDNLLIHLIKNNFIDHYIKFYFKLHHIPYALLYAVSAYIDDVDSLNLLYKKILHH